MARNVQLGDLVTRCQRRADREGDPSVDPNEWKAMISEQYAELAGLISATGMRYFESTSTIAANGATSYAEPTDQLSFIGIDYLLDGTTTGRRRQLREFMAQERNYYAGQTGEAIGFSFVGTDIELWPRPTTGTYELLYVPQPPDLSVGSDSLDVDLVVPDGEAFVLWGVAVKVLSKAEQDPTVAMRERDAARVRVEEWAVLRALNEPRRRTVHGGANPYDNEPGGWPAWPYWYR